MLCAASTMTTSSTSRARPTRLRDIEIINIELIFADIEMLESRIDRVKKSMKGDKTLGGELELLERVYAALSDGKQLHARSTTPRTSSRSSQDCQLLSMKPVIYAANISEDEIGSDMSDNAGYQKLAAYAAEEESQIMPICAGIEADIARARRRGEDRILGRTSE